MLLPTIMLDQEETYYLQCQINLVDSESTACYNKEENFKTCVHVFVPLK